MNSFTMSGYSLHHPVFSLQVYPTKCSYCVGGPLQSCQFGSSERTTLSHICLKIHVPLSFSACLCLSISFSLSVFSIFSLLCLRQFFINLPRGVCSEIASLATFRTIKMNQKLAEDGDEVSTVFFVVRGECVSKSGKQLHEQPGKGNEEEKAQRYGPGDIVGW